MSNYNGNIEKKKSGSGFNEEQKRKYFKVFLRFVKINFCRSCIGSRKRIIKIEKYVISSILTVISIMAAGFLIFLYTPRGKRWLRDEF